MMYQEPEKSPWGKVQTCDLLCPGVFLVSTASHGVLITFLPALFLSLKTLLVNLDMVFTISFCIEGCPS